jgi:MiaB/RimO family radical SAM methylthiotransferase
MYSVVIYTLGCKLNQLESEALADSFRKAGFSLVPAGTAMPGPGIIIINTCTVTSKADQKSRRLIRKALRDNPDSCVLVTGCYAQLNPDEIALLETEDTAGVSGRRHGRRQGRRLFVVGGGQSGTDKVEVTKSALLELPEYLLHAMVEAPNSELPGSVQEEFFTTEYCCPTDSLEFHGNRRKAPRQGALTDKCNRFRRTINSTAYRKCRLGLSRGEPSPSHSRMAWLGGCTSRARRGGKNGFRTKTPRNSVTSVVNSYFSDISNILETWTGQAKGEGPFSFKPEEFSFHSRGYLKIQDGCDKSCTYCRVCLARGSSVSLPPQTALAELRSFEERGCAELMITGINIAQYNHSGLDIAGLLKYLLENSAGIALRLSSLEPEGINEEFASVAAHPRIRPHFHLSMQSGSDTVLRRMGRAYHAQTVEQGAALLRSVKDNPFLACDIIAGFPGETETEFNQTFALCEKIGFAWIHVFPYSKRPGTAAFSLKNPVCERDTMRRVEALTALALRGRRDYAQDWLGHELSAIVEKGKPDSEGHRRVVAENYLKLLVNCSEAYSPGSSLRCIPVSLCAGADGEKPDALAILAD